MYVWNIREAKFITRANTHIQNTAQRMRDESALLTSTLYNLEEEIAELNQRDARTRDMRVAETTQGLVGLRCRLAGVVEVRGAEDNDILDTVIETQKLLQQTVSKERLDWYLVLLIYLYVFLPL